MTDDRTAEGRTNQDRLLIQAYIDGELDAASTITFEQRLRTEPRLAELHGFYAAVVAATGRLPEPEVSPQLLARIVTQSGDGLQNKLLPQVFNRRQFAASLATVAIASASAGYFLRNGPTQANDADMIANSHRRSLLANSPIDIASSDRHTVKPWLDARLGLSPPVIDLGDAGFTLLGGRVDVIGNTASPTLVYRYHEHLISLLAFPLGPDQNRDQPPHRLTTKGLQMVQWNGDGLSYWAVSDAEWSVLERFATGFRSRVHDSAPSG